MKATDSFFRHLEDPAPVFRCRAAGGDRAGRPVWVLPVRHRKGSPASAGDLSELGSQVGPKGPGTGGIRALYERHNGLKLYEGPDRTAAIELFPIRSWKSRTRNMRRWDSAGESPGTIRARGVAIGRAGESGDYLAMDRGLLYLVPHDAPGKRLGSFPAFLASLARDPAAMIRRLGSTVRYSDGCTTRQWYPEAYRGDGRPTEPPAGPRAKDHRLIQILVRYRSGKLLQDAMHNQGGGMSAKGCAASLVDDAMRKDIMSLEEFLDTRRSPPALHVKPLSEINPACDRLVEVRFRLEVNGREAGEMRFTKGDLEPIAADASASRIAEWVIIRARPWLNRGYLPATERIK